MTRDQTMRRLFQPHDHGKFEDSVLYSHPRPEELGYSDVSYLGSLIKRSCNNFITLNSYEGELAYPKGLLNEIV